MSSLDALDSSYNSFIRRDNEKAAAPAEPAALSQIAILIA
jgi:hypothetical protein